MILQDVESGESMNHRHTSWEREAFNQAMDAFSASLDRHCRLRHIQFSRGIVDRAWKEVLIDHFGLTACSQ